MDNQVAGTRCVVQVFPLEGGSYSISSTGTPAQVLSCIVEKDIRLSSGNFEIVLAPGGPSGEDGSPTWIDVLTCMSTVNIGMQRGTRTGVTMIGVITDVSETTMFEEDKVLRTTTVIGKDIGYFWENFSFFTLASLGLIPATASTAITNALGAGATELVQYLNLDINKASGLLEGNPADVADNWYHNVMLRLLARTVLNDGPNHYLTFEQAVTEFIEVYPEMDIPMAMLHMEAEATFDAKMRYILEFPQYEVWYGTLPADFAFDAPSGDNEELGALYTIPQLNASSQAVFMARINPIPVLNDDFVSLDTSKWDFLPLVTADTGYISCTMKFSAGEVANVYMLQATAGNNLLGYSNGGTVPASAFTNVAIDFQSLERFGYRPHWHQTCWQHDSAGKYAQKHTTDDYIKLHNDILARVVSWYHPLALMAHAEVTYPLMPNVFVGSKFQFSPKKYNKPWTFYIKSVTHNFRPGGPSTTTLGLERGLPTSVYSDTQGLLLNVYLGTASRVDGEYGLGENPFGDLEGIQVLNAMTNTMVNYHNQVEELYTQPQTFPTTDNDGHGDGAGSRTGGGSRGGVEGGDGGGGDGGDGGGGGDDGGGGGSGGDQDGTGATAPSGALPATPMGYWIFNYAGPPIQTVQQSYGKANYAAYAVAVGTGNGGTIKLDTGASGALITDWKNAGNAVVLMVGGDSANAGNPAAAYLKSQSDQDQMYDSLVGIVDKFGFQGISMDLESGTKAFTPSLMSGLFGRLKAHYGSDFIIASDARPFEMRGSGTPWYDTYHIDPSLIDVFNIQYYGFDHDSAWYDDFLPKDFNDMINTYGFPSSKINIGCSDYYGGGGPNDGKLTSYYKAVADWQSNHPSQKLRGAIFWSTSSESYLADFNVNMAISLGL